MKPVLTLSILTAFGLSACVSILPDPEPAPSVYRLQTSVAPVDKIANPETIRIDRPGSPQIFNSNDIVVTMDGQKLSAISQAQWSEVTPIVIQDAMIDALSASRGFVGLLPASGARTETRLHLNVKNFEASFDNGPESAPLAVVNYRVTYAKADDRKLLGTYSVRQTHRAASIAVPDVVKAIEMANDRAMSDIVTWLKTQRSSAS